MKTEQLGLIAAVIAAFFFGASNPQAKLAATGTDPVTLSLAVTFIAAIIFAAYALLNRNLLLGIRREDAPLYLGLGLIGHAIPSLLSLYGLTMTNALNLLFLLRAEIFFAAIFGVVIFKESINLRQVAGIAIGFFGVFIFATGLDFGGINMGDMLIILASAFWAGYVVMVRKLSGKVSPVAIASMRAWVALPLLGAAALLFQAPLTVHPAQYGNIAFFAVSTYILGVVAYNSAIKQLGVWKAAIPTQLLSVIFGFIATWWVLGENLSAIKIAGAALIIIGTVLALLKEKESKKPNKITQA